LHLLYARFIGKFLQRQGIAAGVPMTERCGEPFSSLLAQGMVKGKTCRCPTSGRYYKPEEIDWSGEFLLLERDKAFFFYLRQTSLLIHVMGV
jgi:leucyl-tRNA synthetase